MYHQSIGHCLIPLEHCSLPYIEMHLNSDYTAQLFYNFISHFHLLNFQSDPFQGYKRDKTMADKLIYIPHDDTQNYQFCRLQLVVYYKYPTITKKTTI